MRTVRNLVLAIATLCIALHGTEAKAQCAIPVVGCAGVNQADYGLASGTNASLIEYDNFVGSFHSTVARNTSGAFQVWGELMSNSGTTNVLSPQVINVTNYPALTGTVLKASLGSFGLNNVQGVLLSTTGLFVWGTVGAVVPNTIAATTTFQKITVAGKADGLPVGVVPGDVKMMFVTYRTIAITTCSGSAYVLSQRANINQGGSTTAWVQIRTNQVGDPFITNVVAVRGSYGALVALKSDGTMWTWGEQTYLGNNTAVAARNRAAQMTLPVGVTVKMFANTEVDTAPARGSYYLLATNGNLYSLGDNSVRQLGDWTTTNRLSWVQPRYTSTVGPVMNNIAWISSQEHDIQYGCLNVITSAGALYAWGENNFSMLSTATDPRNPFQPTGIPANQVLAVETGGHTSMIAVQCQPNYGYVGHRRNGSMGDGSSATTTETTYTFLTAPIQVCGAGTMPAVEVLSTTVLNNSYCNTGTATITPSQTGGTWVLVSGPGTLAPGPANAVVTFTGTGTVRVDYTVTGICGTSTVTTNLASVPCADIAISKTPSSNSPAIGGPITFTITATNNGPSNATGVVVNDPLPAGYTFVSATPSAGTWTAPNWTIGNLANGASVNLLLTATVNAVGPYNNTANGTATTQDIVPTNNGSTSTPVPVPNNPPVANDDNGGSLTEDGANGTISILTNDTDPNGNPPAAGPTNGAGQFTVDLDAGTAGLQTSLTNAQGVWTYNTANGVVTFDPATNFNGVATLPYTLCDPSAACDPATITFNVTAVNDPPIANDDNGATLTEDGANGTINIISNDTDVDGNPTAPTNGAGQFTVDLDPGTAGVQTTATNAQGVWTYNVNTGVVTFDPAANFNGTATLTYELCDPGAVCDQADISFGVTAANDAPVANDDNGGSLTEDGADGTVNIITNDTDIDGNPTAPTNGVGQFTVDMNTGLAGVQTTITDAQGVWTYNVNTGVVTFDPAANFNGTATLTYELCDPGAVCDQADISFSVTAANDAPVANDDNGGSLTEDGANGTVNIIANDTDVDGNPTAPTNGVGQFVVDLDPGTPGVQTTVTDAQGVWTYNVNTGVVTFDPATNFNGTATLTYELCDPSAVCDQADISFTVTPANDLPVANDDNGGSLTEDGPNGTINVVSNDTDVDGDPTTPTNGVGQFTVDLNTGLAGVQTTITDAQGVWTYTAATGMVTFDPATNFNGTATLPYELCDPSGGCDQANISFSVTSVNDAPVATNDNGGTLTEDGANGTINIIANDTDVDGNPTAPTNGVGQFVVDLDPGTPGVQTTVTDAQGVWTYNVNTGVVTFDPAANFNGTATLTYELCDPGAVCDQADISFGVTAANDAPIANDDNGGSLTEDGADGTVSIITNDTDIDGNPTAPTNGVGQFAVDMNTGLAGVQTTITDAQGVWTYTAATGVVTFNPATNFNGTATLQYQLCDPGALCDNANIGFTVTAANDAPVATNDVGATLTEDGANGTVNIIANDTDVDGNPTAPTNGVGQFVVDLDPGTPGVQTTVTDAQGVWTYNVNTGVVTFDPAANFNGTATLTYELCDPGAVCDQADISFGVTAANDAPIANDDNGGSLTEDGADGTVNIISNDTDIDGNPTAPTNGAGLFTVDMNTGLAGVQTTITDAQGVWTYTAATGVVTFNPANNFNGVATLPYQLCDPGALCDLANITFTVTADNDAPVAGNDVFNLNEDGSISNTVITNDSDPDGEPLTYALVSAGTAGVNGLLTFDPDGDFTFTPNTNFTGTVTFTYQACDPGLACTVATVTITVGPVNDPPVAVVETFTVAENGTLTDDVGGNDSDVDNSAAQLDWSLISGGTADANGTLTFNADGTFIYSPDPGFNGTVSFTYELCDPAPLCDQAVATIVVGPVNDPPVAVDDVFTMNEDAISNSDLGLNDFDPDHLNSDLTWSLLAGGTATANGTLVFNPDGTFSYTPNTNFNGSVSFTYEVCDPFGVCDQGGAVSITVNAVNDAPVALPDAANVNEDAVLNGNLGANDSDVDNTAPQLTWTLVNGGTADANGTVVVNADGTYTYTPDANFTGVVSFTYQVCDPGPLCDQETVTITVNSVNDTPVATNDNGGTISEDGANGTVNIITNDTDSDGNPTAPTNGAGQFVVDLDPGTAGVQTSVTDAQGVWTYNTATGVVTFDPATNFNGTATLTYALCDPGNSCDQADISFTVTPANDLPVANDDNGGSLTEDGPNGTINVVNNDTDVDGDPTTPTNGVGQFTVDMNTGLAGVQTTITDAQGVWTYTAATGVVTFDPATNFNGVATLPYELCDPSNGCDQANISFNVTSVNDTPVATNDNGGTIGEDGANGTVNIITNDTDSDGNPTAPTNGVGQFVVDLDPGTAGVQTSVTDAQGVWTYNVNTGVVTFDPAANFNGTATLTYALCDPGNSCDQADITFTVTPANDLPVANDDNGGSLTEDGPNGTINVVNNDTDVDGDPTTPTNGVGQFTVDMNTGLAGVQTTITDAQGVWTYTAATGVVTFDPATNFNGVATLPYELCDPSNGCDQANISFNVTSVNDAPVATNDNGGTIGEDGANGTVNIITNDTDNDGNPTTPTNGAGQFVVDLDPVTPGVQTSVTDAQGVWTYNTATGVVTFDPATNFNGTATLTYALCDPGNSCDQADISFTVTPANDLPVANDDNGGSLTEDGPNGTINVVSNDTDVDGDPTTPTNGVGQFTVDLNTGLAGVQTTITNTQGVWTYNPATGVVTFDPAINFNGTATLPYELCDPSGGCDQANISFSVTSVNDAPVATNDNGGTISEDGANGTVNIITNDTDSDGNPTAPTNGAGQFVVDLDPGTAGVQTSVTDAQGVWTYNTATGVVTFDPATNFNGTATLTYSLCDPGNSCDQADITFTVTPVNDLPVANDDNGGSLTEDGPNGTINVVNNDTDVDGDPTAPTNGVGQFTVDLNTGLAGVQTTITDAQGVWTYTAATGMVTFDPATNFNGTATLPYELCDPSGGCDQANISFTVNPTNDNPVVNDDLASTNEEQSVDIAVTSNDTDVDGNIVAGTLTIVVPPTNGTLTIGLGGVITYTPNADFTGTDQFTYEVCDDGTPLPAACDQAVVVINVNNINDPPIANDDAINGVEDGGAITGDLGFNDGDIDDPNNTLMWSLVNGGTAAANGILVVNTDGTFSFTPNANFNGVVDFIYQVCDPGGLCDLANVTIGVAAVNDQMIAVDDVDNTLPDQQITTNVVANDTDPNDPNGGADPATVTIIAGPFNGTATANANGTITYTPAPGYVGLDSVQYSVCDLGDAPPPSCDMAWLVITIDNSFPLAVDDFVSIDEDNSTTITVLGNDSSPLGVLLPGSVTITSPPANGTVTVNPDGTILYVPDPDFNGVDDFNYQVCNDLGYCSIGTVTVTVHAVNDPPVAIDEAASTSEDVPVIVDVLLNDSEPADTPGDIDPATVAIVNGPTNGTVVVNANGTITYTPNLDYTGNDSFTYAVCDDGTPLPPACDTAVVTIAVGVVNDAPVITDGGGTPADTLYFTTTEELALLLCVDAMDPDGDPIDLTAVVSGPFNGGVSGIADGDTCITYTPDPDFTGTDEVIVTVCDAFGLCDQAVLIITVLPVNDDPVIVDGNGDPVDTLNTTTPEDTPITICLDALDADGDPLDVTGFFGGPGNGTISGLADGDTCFTYTPDPDFNGTDIVDIIVCDDNGGCDTVSVTIDVTPVNDGPVIVDGNGDPIDSLGTTTPEDTPITICLDALDLDGDPLDVTGTAGGPSNGSISGLADGDTCFTYTPDPDFNGTDIVDIIVCDDNGGCDTVTVTINVTPVNDDPVIVDGNGDPVDSLNTATPEDTPITICLDALDLDGDPMDVTGTAGGPSNGTISGLADGDTCFTYTPDPDWNGSDVVDIIVCDNNGGCDTVTVTINVTPVNDDPVVTDGGSPADTLYVFGQPNEQLVICPEVNDADGDALDVVLAYNGPDSGAVGGILDGDTCFTYLPNTNFQGSDTVTVVISDGNGGADTVVVVITIIPNDPPIADADTISTTTPEDTPIVICIGATDPNGDPLEVTSAISGPLNGTLTGLNTGDTCFTYIPDPDWNGTDTVTVVICDPFNDCDTVTVIIDVTPVEDVPVIVDGNGDPVDVIVTTTPEDEPITICLDAIDADGDTLDVVSVINGPLNGQVTGVLNGDTCFTYMPDPDWNGTDTLEVVVCDGNGLCDTVTVVIDVTPVDDVPVIVDGNGDPVDTLNTTTPEDTPITICLDAIDADGDTLDVVSVINGPLNGQITGTLDGDTCFTYIPDPGFTGTDTMSVVVCDGTGVCDTVTVIIDVTPIITNDPPIAVDDVASTTVNTGVTITVLGNDSDPNGDTLTVTSATAGNGTVVINGDGTIVYTPNTGFCGTDTITYTISDGNGGTDTAIVIVDIPCPNDPPIAVDDVANTTVGTPVTIDVQDNDSDPDGDTLTTTSATAGNGSVTVNGDGTITYTPDAGFCGTDTITYTISDGNGGTDTAIVIVDVPCPNQPPIAVDDVASTTVNTGVTITVLGNDSDPNGDTLTVTSATAGNGTVVINGDGTITYTPDPGFCGTDTITYTISDGNGGTDTAIVIVDVPCPNQPPNGVNDSTSVDAGDEVTIDVLDNDSDPNGDPLTVTDATAGNGTVTINGDGTITYTPDPGFCGTDTITYVLCDTVTLCDTAMVFVEVACPDDPLVIPGGFSPDGDGIADTWVIQGLENYPLATVLIFNRWGNQVYNAEPYANDWDGRSNNSLTIGELLPVGTYWYILDLGVEGEEVRSSYIYLIR